jgi:hypothetical protein
MLNVMPILNNIFLCSGDPGGVVDASDLSGGLSGSSDQELATAAAAVENDKNGLQEAVTTAPGMK